MTERQFLVDINPEIELPKYDLVLCKLNKEPICEVHNILDVQIKAYHSNIDEISFTIPFYRNDETGNQIKNELFNLVDGSMMVEVNSTKYFILTKPEIKTNEQTGEIYKSILGFSREYEFGQKLLVGYDAPSRLLYDYTNQKDESGLEIGFLNMVERVTSWRVGYINANLLTKYRHLSFSKSTYLQTFQEVQKSFGCLFKFNTKDKIIDVYEVTQLGDDKGLYISDANFISNLTQTINHDEIKTRLSLYGRDNISIQSLNITGQSYIENFAFFKNTKYMSQSLIDALNTYEAYIQTKQGQFEGYLTNLETLNDSLSTKKIELTALQGELKVIQSNIDVAIADNQPTATLKTQETDKINEINSKQTEIDDLISQIDAIHTNIDNLGQNVSLNNHLTVEQLEELDHFIREDEYSDSNYTEDNIQELLDEGKAILNKISYPNLQFDIDVEDFLSLVEGQHIWSSFILGDIVTVEHEELNFSYKVRLVGYTHSPDNNKLNLIFSNRESVDDANIYLKELLENLTTTASTVDFSRFKWDKSEEAKSSIDRYVSSALDLAKQSILKAEGQRPIMDTRGLWMTKEEPDGSISPKQMRIINNILAITNDNWNTVSTAVSGDGIMGEVIVGKLGAFATVQANQIVVGDDGSVLSDDVLGGSILKQDGDYNGVVINTSQGLQVTASNNLTRSTFNANNGILIESRPNTSTEWERSFYVDTNGKIQAKNIVIDGSGTFKGKIEADSGYFKGNITGATGTFTGIVNASDYQIGGESLIDIATNKIKGEFIKSIKTDQLVAGTAVIKTGMIESLIVGTNVTMGANAVISWGQVTEQPYIPTDAYITQITKNTITTQYINALEISAKKIGTTGSDYAEISGGVFNLYQGGTLSFSLQKDLYLGTMMQGYPQLRFYGNVDFSYADVNGLTLTFA